MAGLGDGGETGGDEEPLDLGRHGLGATAGLGLLRAGGDRWESKEDWERGHGFGAMGGLVETGSFGLGANGGFFIPVLMTPDFFSLLSP